MNDQQINDMVSRFLAWRLPENFNPDGGISFAPTYNTWGGGTARAEPVGTNLFSFDQAKQMVLHMLGDAALTSNLVDDRQTPDPAVNAPDPAAIREGEILEHIEHAKRLRRYDWQEWTAQDIEDAEGIICAFLALIPTKGAAE